MGQTRALASLHSTTSSFYTTLATTTHNKKLEKDSANLMLLMSLWDEGE
jgi:hypothetical protein